MTSWLTYIIIAVIILSVFFGWRNGFVRTLMAMVSWILVILLAGWMNPYVSGFLRKNTSIETYLTDECTAFLEDHFESGDSPGAEEQNNWIESLTVPESLKNALKENNNEQAYQTLGVSGFSDYVGKYLAHGITNGIAFLLAVFLATSDEAVLIILGNPGRTGEVGMLLGAKVLIAVIGGYAADLFLKERLSSEKSCGNLCDHCGCHEAHAGILMPAWRHTFRLFAYLFIFTWILNLVIEVFGIEGLSRALLGDSVFQPVIAALIGLIPNCGASVILTQLYLSGAISFASVVAGLCTGAGAGLIVLFKVNRNRIENIKIMIVLYFMAVVAGLLLQFVN